MTLIVFVAAALSIIWFDTWFKPATMVKYYPKAQHRVVIVKEIQYKISYKLILDDDMKLLTKYIKHKQPKMPIEIAERTAFEIIRQSHEANVPWHVVVGIVQCESYFYPGAISRANARGLMQILRAHKIVIDKKRAYDIEYNIAKGIEILIQKLKRTKGDLGQALSNYSGGHKAYERRVIFENMGELMLFKIKNKAVPVSVPDKKNTKKFKSEMKPEKGNNIEKK